MHQSFCRLLAVFCLLGATGHAGAIHFVFDYSLDTNNFFDTQAKRDALESAATAFEVLTDRLDAIVPGTVHNEGLPGEYTDTWTANFSHPSTSTWTQHFVDDVVVPADTLLVFVGGYHTSSTLLAWADTGSGYSNGSSEFNISFDTRGQPGVRPWFNNDVAPWGGSISFNTAANWNFDTQTGPSYNESDFASVVVHELGHLLGFGSSTPFSILSPGTQFTGPRATEVYGSAPSLSGDKLHWQSGTRSPTLHSTTRETSMDPEISDGAVKPFTMLDFAALDDIGWQVPLTVYGGLEGDLDSDGFVGIADLNTLLGVWNQDVTPGDYPAGDPSGDGFVGIEDLNQVLGNWNAGTPPTGGAVVPEPAVGLLTVLMLPMLGRRRV